MFHQDYSLDTQAYSSECRPDSSRIIVFWSRDCHVTIEYLVEVSLLSYATSSCLFEIKAVIISILAPKYGDNLPRVFGFIENRGFERIRGCCYTCLSRVTLFCKKFSKSRGLPFFPFLRSKFSHLEIYLVVLEQLTGL